MSGPTGDAHLAMPLGITGQSSRFDDTMLEPTTEQLADQVLADPALTAAVFADCAHRGDQICVTDGHDHHEIPDPPGVQQADPDDVRRLIELVDRPGTTAIHVGDGDELLLLMPDADPDHQAAAVRALADMFPTVSFLLLSGITGAIVMPRRTPEWDGRLGCSLHGGISVDRGDDQTGWIDCAPNVCGHTPGARAEYRRLTAERDRLIAQGVPPDQLVEPLNPFGAGGVGIRPAGD